MSWCVWAYPNIRMCMAMRCARTATGGSEDVGGFFFVMFFAPPPSHLSAGGRRGRPSYQKNGRARNRQRPLAAIVSVRACHKTLKVLEERASYSPPAYAIKHRVDLLGRCSNRLRP